MSLYDDIGPAIVGAFVTDRYFSVLESPHLWRGDEGDPATAATPATDRGAITATVIRNAGSKMQQTAAEGSVWASDWLVMAAAGASIQAGDILTDYTRAYVVTATPETDLGFLLAPAEVYTAVPVLVTTQAGFRSPLWIFGLGATA
jgi:hypothetical protein